jgi:hypothetical protein
MILRLALLTGLLLAYSASAYNDITSLERDLENLTTTVVRTVTEVEPIPRKTVYVTTTVFKPPNESNTANPVPKSESNNDKTPTTQGTSSGLANSVATPSTFSTSLKTGIDSPSTANIHSQVAPGCGIGTGKAQTTTIESSSSPLSTALPESDTESSTLNTHSTTYADAGVQFSFPSASGQSYLNTQLHSSIPSTPTRPSSGTLRTELTTSASASSVSQQSTSKTTASSTARVGLKNALYFANWYE